MFGCQLGQSASYKWFTDWSNNTWQVGNPTQGKPQRDVNCYTTAEYTANPVPHCAHLVSKPPSRFDFWWCHGIFPSFLMQCTCQFLNGTLADDVISLIAHRERLCSVTYVVRSTYGSNVVTYAADSMLKEWKSNSWFSVDLRPNSIVPFDIEGILVSGFCKKYWKSIDK